MKIDRFLERVYNDLNNKFNVKTIFELRKTIEDKNQKEEEEDVQQYIKNSNQKSAKYEKIIEIKSILRTYIDDKNYEYFKNINKYNMNDYINALNALNALKDYKENNIENVKNYIKKLNELSKIENNDEKKKKEDEIEKLKNENTVREYLQIKEDYESCIELEKINTEYESLSKLNNIENENVKEYKDILDKISNKENDIKEVLTREFENVFNIKLDNNMLNIKVLDKLVKENEEKYAKEDDKSYRYKLSKKEINQIYNILRKYGNSKYVMKKDINNIVKRLKNGKKLTKNQLNIIKYVKNYEYVNSLDNKEFKIHFVDSNKPSIESITNNYNREVKVDSTFIDNEGFVKDDKIDFLAVSGNIFTNQRGKDETFIPQHNNVDLGENLSKILRISGYRYNNNNKNFINEDKLNVNGIAKFAQSEEMIKLIVNNIIDNQKNTNLSNMLNTLNEYYNKKLENNNNERRKIFNYDVNDPDVWVNNILKFNLVDIFMNSYDKFVYLDELKKNIGNNIDNLSKEYYIQLLVTKEFLKLDNNKFSDDENIYKIENINKFSTILNKLNKGSELNDNEIKLIKDVLSSKHENLKSEITIALDKGITQANRVRISSLDLINTVNGKIKDLNDLYNEFKNHYEKEESKKGYKLKKNIDKNKLSRVENFKRTKDNFDSNNEHKGFSFFGNLPCKFYDKEKYDSLGDITKKCIDKSIPSQDDKKKDENINVKKIYLKASLLRSLFEKLFPVNNDGTSQGYSTEQKHLNEIFETSSAIATTNNKSCFGGMKQSKKQENKNNKRKRSGEQCKNTAKFITNGIKEEIIASNKYSDYEKLSDELSFMILAASTIDGTMAKEIDKDGNLKPIQIKVIINGEEKELSVNKIIPSLKNLKGKELEDKFYKLYEMATVHYLSHFEFYYDEVQGKLVFNKDEKETLKNKNILSQIIKAYNVKEDNEIETFKLLPKDMNIHYSTDDKLDEKFKDFIYDADINEILNINDENELNKFIEKHWNESGEDSNYDEDTKFLYKIMAVHCAKSSQCKDQFRNTNKDKLSFSIVNYTSDNKGESIDNYSLIIYNDDTKETINAFTINNANGDYDFDKLNEFNVYSNEDLSKFNKNKSIKKINIENSKYAFKPGIGLIAECEFEFEDSEGNIIKPDQYAFKKEDFDKLYDDEPVVTKYDVKNDGKYDMNLVEVDTLKLNNIADEVLENISFKDVGRQIASKRNNYNLKNKELSDTDEKINEESMLTDYEIDVLDNLSNIMLNNELFDEEKGVNHHNNEESFGSNFSNIKESVNVQNEIKTIQNHQNGCLSGGSGLRKRASGGKCMKCMEISKNYGVEDRLIESLSILKKYDSNNIKVQSNEKSISNPKELCNNAATLTDVLEVISDSYENVNNMDKEDSEKMIIKLQEFVKGLEYRYKSSDYLTHESIRDINKYDINDMIGLCNDLLKAHENKFGKIIDKNGKKVNKITENNSDIDSESKCINDELHEVLNNVHDILNEYNQDLSNTNLVDDIDINNKSGREDRTYEVSYLSSELENMIISGSKESKEKVKSDLLKIYDKLNELEKVINKSNFNSDEFVNNSETIYKLSDGVINKLKENYSDDKEVQDKVKLHKNSISGIKKTAVESSNILNSDHIIGQVDIEDYIFNDPKSKYFVKRYFDNLKDSLYDVNDNEEHKLAINKIKAIKEKLNDKIKILKNYDSIEGHYQEAYHLVELVNNYNELVSSELSFDRENSEINYIYISNDIDLSNMLNYIRVKVKNKATNKIIKNNSNLFKLKGNQNMEEFMKESKSNSKVYGCKGEFIQEGSHEDYLNMLRSNEALSKHEVLNLFIDSSNEHKQLMKIKESYNLGYNLVINEIPEYRNEDMIDRINHLESKNNKKVLKNIKNNDTRYLESSKQTEDRLKSNIIAEAKLKDIDAKTNIDEVLIRVQNEKNMENMSDKQISGVKKQIENLCIHEKNEIIKFSGITPNDSYEDLNEGYDSFKSNSVKILKKLSDNENNNNDNNENYKKLNVNKNILKHNIANSKALSSNSPIAKNPPSNKHKFRNKYKRNIIIHSFY